MRVTGAGVLAYTVHRGNVLVLLGRERIIPGWRYGSHKWSNFSGKVEMNESALEGAAREFVEESCACVPVSSCHSAPTRPSDVLSKLRTNAHLIEQSTDYKGETLVYSTYIIRIPHSEYESVFRGVRDKLQELDTICRHFYRVRKHAANIPRFMRLGFMLSAQIVVADINVVGSNEVEIVLHESGTSADIVSMIEVCSATAMDLLAVQVAWRRVVDYLEWNGNDPIISHPALQITRSRHRIVSITVNKAYLEKCEIRWWKLNALLDMQYDMSVTGGDGAFRKIFIDNIASLGDHILQIEQLRKDTGEETSEK